MTNKNDKRILIPAMVLLIASLLMFVTMFMPYMSATDDYAEMLEEYSTKEIDDDLEMTGEDAMSISLFEFADMAMEASEYDDDAMVYLIVIAVMGLFSFLTLLFSIFKKPIASFLLSLPACLLFFVLSFDFSERGVVSGEMYDWGFGYYLFYIMFVVVLISSVWLLVNKIRVKREIKRMGATA